MALYKHKDLHKGKEVTYAKAVSSRRNVVYRQELPLWEGEEPHAPKKSGSALKQPSGACMFNWWERQDLPLHDLYVQVWLPFALLSLLMSRYSQAAEAGSSLSDGSSLCLYCHPRPYSKVMALLLLQFVTFMNICLFCVSDWCTIANNNF